MTIFLSGEGRAELGGLTGDPAYHEPTVPGLIVAWMELEGAPVTPLRATQWKDIRVYRAGGHRSAEQRRVLGLCLRAQEATARALVFLRDGDGDHERERQIAEALDEARARWPELTIVPGVPQRSVEAWVLAYAGRTRASELSDPRAELRTLATTVAEMVELVRRHATTPTAADARTLQAWLAGVASLAAR